MFIRVSVPAAFLALGALVLQAQDLFVLPGAESSSQTVEVFSTVSTPSAIRSFMAGPGAFRVISNLNGTKFYVIANSTSQTVTSTDDTFLSPKLVGNLPVAPTGAVLTPDGALLAVAAATVHLFDTSTDTEVVSGGISQGSGITTYDVACSLDGGTLFALGSTSTGSQVTAISTASRTASVSLAINQLATGIAVGPNGLVYVSLPNQVLELDPRTLTATPRGTMTVNGTPGPLVFTPDGQYAVGAIQSGVGTPLVLIALGSHTVSSPSINVPQFRSLVVTGTNTLLGLVGQSLYQINISGSVTATQPNLPSGVLALTTSNEVPYGAQANVQSVYYATGTTLYQMSPSTNSPTASYPLANNVAAGALSFTAPALTTAQPRSLVAYGANQEILPSATSKPLVVQVLDANNHPVMGTQVQFQSSSASATLSSTSATSGSNGYVLTYLTAPATAGIVTVTATVGSLSATFTIDVNSSAGGVNSPTLSILAGQGQLMYESTTTSQAGSPLKVLLADANGNPLIGQPVTFTIVSSGLANLGSLQANGAGYTTVAVNTDVKGQASVDFLSPSILCPATAPYIQTSITASSSGTNTVLFYISTVKALISGNCGVAAPASIYPIAPKAGTTLTGTANGTLPGAISFQVKAGSQGIPNVSLTVTSGNADPTQNPSATCNGPNGGFAMTNSNGDVSCDVKFGPRIGSGNLTPVVGYFQTATQIPFTVTSGPPGVVQITQGNSQSGLPGQKLQALQVHVTDLGGNAITGAALTWQVIPASSATLTSVSSATDAAGNGSAIVTLGSVAGPFQVQVAVGAVSATFNLSVVIPAANLLLTSGTGQTTQINTAFPAPLVVQVLDAGNNGIPGVQVNFQVTSGTATLGTPTVATDSNGQASTTVQAGATAGPISVTATSAGFNVTFSLTAILPGPINLAIVNGATFDPTTGISPGGIAIITGNGILPGVQGLVVANSFIGPLPDTLEGASVTFDGTPAPIYYVMNSNGTEQMAVQVPFEVQPGPAVNIVVNASGGGSSNFNVAVKPFAPGVFFTMYGNQKVATATRPDGSFVSPNNPAQRGETISFYVTGLGTVDPATATGAIGLEGQTQAVQAPMIIGLNDSGVPLISAAYAPGMVGVYVITIQVPAKTKAGPAQPVGLIIFDPQKKAYFGQAITIPIQ